MLSGGKRKGPRGKGEERFENISTDINGPGSRVDKKKNKASKGILALRGGGMREQNRKG